MRLEHIPLILGVIVALIGLGFIADASMAAAAPVTPERRRRARAEPSRTGEALVGIGTLCMAAALFGRDTWRYGTVAVLTGSVLLLIGVILNRAFLKEALLFRGPARRSEEGVSSPHQGKGGAGGMHRRHAPAQPNRAEAVPLTPDKPITGSGAATRHPTPPLASRAYRPTEPGTSASSPATGQPRFDAAKPPAPPPPPAPPESGRADAGQAAAPRPANAPQASRPRPSDPPPPPPGKPPTGPQERRKTPRGKR